MSETPNAAHPADTIRARLLSHHGRQAWVLDDQGHKHLCVYKGRELQPTTNDWVNLDLAAEPAVITAVQARKNEIGRSESHKSKTIAANVDQVVIVISGSPLFSDELLSRMICACAVQNIPGIIVLNKIDLADDTFRAKAQLSIFKSCMALLDWQLIELAAKPKTANRRALELGQLQTLLNGKTSLIMGQSGMGKSSLLNALVPGINAQTREISEALQTGKHTTTVGQVVQYGTNGWLIDTPGFQLFGLNHLSESQIALGFPEWQQVHDRNGRCRFANCLHTNEPGCKIQEAAQTEIGINRRLAIWQRLVAN